MSNWNSNNRCKFLLQYHLIFVCKYRYEILSNKEISNDIKLLFKNICNKHSVFIKYMESDKNHIHYLLETSPNINISNLIKTIKSYTTYHIWNKYNNILNKHYWKERILWTDGYFICSIGNVSENQLKDYINNQG
jgi:putative transposase